MDSQQQQSNIEVVQIDGLVLLKIIKHSQQNPTEVVTGQLLGLGVDDVLEVTDCFPVADDDDDGDAYQLEMMKCLRAVNVDNNTVGWYQSAFLGTHLELSMVEAQYDFQKHMPNSVVLVYDQFKTAGGTLSLKAYRLTDSFMTLYGKGSFSSDDFAEYDLESTDIFQEIDIKVHNSHLIHGFLYELREQKSMNCTFDRLDINTRSFLQKNLGFLGDAIGEYCAEQSKFQYHQRQLVKQKASQEAWLKKRQMENRARQSAGKAPLPEEDAKPLNKPSRLETMMILNQLRHFTSQVTSAATLGFNKMYVTEALQNPHVESSK